MKDTQKEEGNSSQLFNTVRTRDNTPQDYNYNEYDSNENIFSVSDQYDNILINPEFHQDYENSNENVEEPFLQNFNSPENYDTLTNVNPTVSSTVQENQFQESNQETIGDEIPQTHNTISEETKESNRNQRARKYDTDNMNEKILTFFLKSLLKYVNQKSKKLYPNKYKFRTPSRKFFPEKRWQKNRQNVLNKTVEFYLSLEINGKYTTKEKDINKKNLEILKKKSTFETFVTETFENIYINMFLKENSIDSDGNKMENIFDMIEKEKKNHDHLYIELLEKRARKFIKY